MNRVTIDVTALEHNHRIVDSWMRRHGAEWTLVSKVLCGHAEALAALRSLEIRSVADSRWENLRSLARELPGKERWYLRPPQISHLAEVVAVSEVSLHSERDVLVALDAEAARQGRRHRVILMVELGDLREGILPGDLVPLYEEILRLDHVEAIGIGANLGCISGVVPTVDHFNQLALYRELLELKFERPLSLISAGSTIVIPLLLQGELPRAINHFRIGEALFLGTDLVHGGVLPDLRDDAFTVEAEIVEIQEKSLVPLGETAASTPFEVAPTMTDDAPPGQRGYRAVLAMGQLDTEIADLRPVDPGVQIAGASSDLSVVNLTQGPGDLRVGDALRFRPGYGALVRLMASAYVEKRLHAAQRARPVEVAS